MKVPWFQHDSYSLLNGDIFDGMKKFGDSAYVVYFGLLEIMSRNFNPKTPTKSIISLERVEKDLCKKWEEIEPILNFFCLRERFKYQLKSMHGIDMIVLKNKKYKETMSEYAKKIVRKLTGEKTK